MYLLDTNLFIYLMKNTYPSLTERILSHDLADLLIWAIIVFELEYGAERHGFPNIPPSINFIAERHERVAIL